MNVKRTELIVVLGALTAFAPLSIDMYLPALPTLEKVFVTDPASVQVTLAVFFLGFALGQTFFGPILDRFGRKPPLYVSLTIYILASAGCAMAPSIEALSVLRFIQAVGACAGVVSSRAMVRDLFEPKEMARVFSALMLVMGVAPILAPLIGGYVMAAFGWRAIFWTLALFGVFCLVAMALRLPESHHAAARKPLHPGAILRGYGRLLIHRDYICYALTGGFPMAGMFAYIAGSPFVFIELYGVAPQDYGWFFGANALGFVAVAQVNARLVRRFEMTRILRAANAVQTVFGILLVGLALTGAGGLFGLAAALFGFIACIGLILPNASALAMAPHGERAGSAAALLGTLQFALAAVAAMSVGAIHDASALPMAGIIAICGALGALASRLTKTP